MSRVILIAGFQWSGVVLHETEMNIERGVAPTAHKYAETGCGGVPALRSHGDHVVPAGFERYPKGAIVSGIATHKPTAAIADLEPTEGVYFVGIAPTVLVSINKNAATQAAHSGVGQAATVGAEGTVNRGAVVICGCYGAATVKAQICGKLIRVDDVAVFIAGVGQWDVERLPFTCMERDIGVLLGVGPDDGHINGVGTGGNLQLRIEYWGRRFGYDNVRLRCEQANIDENNQRLFYGLQSSHRCANELYG